MKICLIIVVTLFLFAAWFSWFGRYTTNTAGGRFFKSDRRTGDTVVVEKDGNTHLLACTQKKVSQTNRGEEHGPIIITTR